MAAGRLEELVVVVVQGSDQPPGIDCDDHDEQLERQHEVDCFQYLDDPASGGCPLGNRGCRRRTGRLLWFHRASNVRDAWSCQLA
jgi:hypothetical protein